MGRIGTEAQRHKGKKITNYKQITNSNIETKKSHELWVMDEQVIGEGKSGGRGKQQSSARAFRFAIESWVRGYGV